MKKKKKTLQEIEQLVIDLKKKKSNDVKTLRSDKRGEFIDELKIYA